MIHWFLKGLKFIKESHYKWFWVKSIDFEKLSLFLSLDFGPILNELKFDQLPVLQSCDARAYK